MTATQPCTAMVRRRKGVPELGGPSSSWMEPCGEPVAELGPCAVLVKGNPCGLDDRALHADLYPEHDYQGRLVHVTLGDPCVQCMEPRSKHGRLGFEHCPDVPFSFLGDPMTTYASTVTELDVGHEAEVSDG